MKNKILLAFALFCCSVLMAVAQNNSFDEEIFVVVETSPEYPGGEDSLYAFLSRNISYPAEAKAKGIEGRVYVTFVVEKNGALSSFKILRDIGAGCGAEAVRVLKKMPKWIPGKQRGKPVRVRFNLPVSFTLPVDKEPVKDTPVLVMIDDGLIEEEIFVVVETQPEFPGGEDSLSAFLSRNIKYPAEAKAKRIEGTVYATFVVDADGTPTSFRILREIDLNSGFGDEVLRVLKKMPKWSPGKQRGKPVRVQFNLPVSFTLPVDNENK